MIGQKANGEKLIWNFELIRVRQELATHLRNKKYGLTKIRLERGCRLLGEPLFLQIVPLSILCFLELGFY